MIQRARHPFFRFRTLCGLGLLGSLAACADSGQKPTMPATDEAQLYRAHARGHYAEPGPPGDPWRPYIKEAARRFDVPEPWIRAVIHQESGVFGQYALSAPGAMGLMQVMPFTYDEMRAQYGLGDDAYDPHDNIMAGTAYVRQMYDLYGTPGFLAAYNAGPGRLDAFLTRDKPLPAETRHYVAMIGPKIAGIYPANRSQTDLMATAAHGGEATFAAAAMPVQSNAQTRSVQLAWANRDGGGQSGAVDTNVPVQVAEAPIAAEPAPRYGAGWQQVGVAPATGRSAVAAAWAQRQSGIASSAPSVPTASATPVQGVLMASNTIAPIGTAAAAPTGAEDDDQSDGSDDATATAQPKLRLASVHLPPSRQHLLPVAGGHGGWAIQVGAFGSQRQANAAAGEARSRTGLQGAHAEVESLHRGHVALYRARLTGLSRDAATRACARMRDCIIVSPNAS